MNTVIRPMKTADMGDWLSLSRQYDECVLMSGGNLREWYEGSSGDCSFSDYMNAKILKNEAVIATSDGKCTGAAAFSATNNKITFFAVSRDADFPETGRKLIEYALSRLDTAREITVNTIRCDAAIIQSERALLDEYGFKIKAGGTENCVPVDIWRRI